MTCQIIIKPPPSPPLFLNTKCWRRHDLSSVLFHMTVLSSFPPWLTITFVRCLQPQTSSHLESFRFYLSLTTDMHASHGLMSHTTAFVSCWAIIINSAWQLLNQHNQPNHAPPSPHFSSVWNKIISNLELWYFYVLQQKNWRNINHFYFLMKIILLFWYTYKNLAQDLMP